MTTTTTTSGEAASNASRLRSYAFNYGETSTTTDSTLADRPTATASFLDDDRNKKSKERRRHRRLKLSQQQQQQQRRKQTKNAVTTIQNFRPAIGFDATASPTAGSVYRCGSTDVLGEKIRRRIRISSSPSSLAPATIDEEWSNADKIVFRHAGLIIDLRSPAERNEDNAQRWMEDAAQKEEEEESTTSSTVFSSYTTSSFRQDQQQRRRWRRPIRVLTVPVSVDAASSSIVLDDTIFEDVDNMRYVIRLDILNRKELLRYAQDNWLQQQSSMSTIRDGLLSEIANSDTIMEELNKRGLAGLNEAILETLSGQLGLCRALQLMTLYREAVVALRTATIKKNDSSGTRNGNRNGNNIMNDDDDDTSIIFHCVQGKDR